MPLDYRQLYSQILEPLETKLTKKNNKTIAITAAVAITAYVFIDKLFRPPRKLRHVPYQGYLGFWASFLRGDTYWDKALNFYLPTINSPDNEGIYMSYDRNGWNVHIANPEDAKQVLMNMNSFPKAYVTRGKEDTLNGRYLSGRNILMENGQHWKSQRMIANPAFRRAMPVKLFGKLSVDLFNMIEQNGSQVEVTDLMQRLTLDVIGNAGFGFDFKAVTDKDNEWISIYHDIKQGMQDPFFFLMPRLDQYFLWLFPKRRAIHRQLDRFFKMLEQMIVDKRNFNSDTELEENEKDLLTLMIEGEARGEGILTNQELRSNLAVFFLAGHDTTSSALSFAIYYLARYPEYQRKAREEVISILGDTPEDIVPTVDQTKHMILLDQIIKETLRISCPVTFAVPRIASEDTSLASGKFIPQGTMVTVDMLNIHHNTKVWKTPSQFIPERFAEDGEASQIAGEGFPWLPFGNGPRTCIGKNFSMVEQYVFLSMLLKKYIWSLPENSVHKDNVKVKGMGVIFPDNLEIKFQKSY